MGRENETEPARIRRIIADRERKRLARCFENPDLKVQRREADRIRKRLTRDSETPEAKKIRRAAERERRKQAVAVSATSNTTGGFENVIAGSILPSSVSEDCSDKNTVPSHYYPPYVLPMEAGMSTLKEGYHAQLPIYMNSINSELITPMMINYPSSMQLPIPIMQDYNLLTGSSVASSFVPKIYYPQHQLKQGHSNRVQQSTGSSKVLSLFSAEEVMNIM